MSGITYGDRIGLVIILFAIVLAVASIIWAIKSKCRSLGPMVLSIVAAIVCYAGMAIALIS